MSRYAISDIHGCAQTFKQLVQQINLTKNDELFLLGDYIDRGPDSKGVIDFIWELEEQGFTVHCLSGNHERMFLDAYNGTWLNRSYWRKHGGKETLLSFGVASEDEIPVSYIQFFLGLKSHILTPGYILVHAGLDLTREDVLTNEVAMLWSRNWYDADLKYKLKDRIVLHGHTPTNDDEIVDHAKTLVNYPVLDIDAGCVYTRKGLNHLCAFNLDTQEVFFVSNCD